MDVHTLVNWLPMLFSAGVRFLERTTSPDRLCLPNGIGSFAWNEGIFESEGASRNQDFGQLFLWLLLVGLDADRPIRDAILDQ